MPTQKNMPAYPRWLSLKAVKAIFMVWFCSLLFTVSAL
jgi:hypothetical protein